MIPYFRRGSGPLISVLLATRGRPELLKLAVRSCVDLAEDPSRVEFVFAVDEDDEATRDAVPLLDFGRSGWKLVVSPRGRGYADMHLRLGAMAGVSEGDWLLIFNDDAKILTPEWDEVLDKASITPGWYGIDDICLLIPRTNDPDSYSFPLVRRAMFRMLGRLSPAALADTYLFNVASAAGAVGWVDILVEHNTLLDQTTEESREARFLLGVEVRSIPTLKKGLQDAQFLVGQMEVDRGKRGWTSHPKGPGWYWLRGKDMSADEAVQVLVTEDARAVLFGDGSARDLVGSECLWSLRVGK